MRELSGGVLNELSSSDQQEMIVALGDDLVSLSTTFESKTTLPGGGLSTIPAIALGATRAKQMKRFAGSGDLDRPFHDKSALCVVVHSEASFRTRVCSFRSR